MSTHSEELVDTLDDVTDDQFKRFKFHVKQEVPEGCKKIPESKVDKADRSDLVELMVQHYQDGARSITLKILGKIGRNDLVERMKKSSQGAGLGPTPSVPAPTPSVPAPTPSVSAEEKLRSARTEFISRASEPTLHQLLDKLLDCGVLTDPEMESAAVISNRADKARVVIDTVRKKGEAACSAMIRELCEVDRCLSTELKLV